VFVIDVVKVWLSDFDSQEASFTIDAHIVVDA